MHTSFAKLVLLVSLYGSLHSISYTQSTQCDDSEYYGKLINAICQAQSSITSIYVYGTSQGQNWSRIGSGFIYHPNGLVVTHQRVIQDGDSISIVLSSGKRIRACFVHSDTETGIALLQTMSPVKNALILKKPDPLKPESMVYILGNSLGVFPSLAQGTYTGRNTRGSLLLDIQPPPGNCGSPVFDIQGNVIGILTGFDKKHLSASSVIKVNRTAVPIEKIHQIVQVLSHRFTDHKGWIGITVVDICTLSKPGVRVVDIVPNGPADKAKICKGDTIIDFNKKPVLYAKDLAFQISETQPKQKISFTICRNGKIATHTIQVRYAPWRYQVQQEEIP